MINNNHFPGLEGELIVRTADGKIKSKQNLHEPFTGTAEIIAQIHSCDGKLVKEKKIPFKSFTDNMAKMLLAGFENLTTGTEVLMTDTSNATGYSKGADVETASAIDASGIIVGLNNSDSGYDANIGTEVNKDDYNLRLQVTHGTGAGQLSHGACTSAYTWGNADGLVFSRTFTNSSGATITVKEIGVVGDDGAKKYLVARDVNDSVQFPQEDTGTPTAINLVIADGQVLTITYSFKIGDSGGITDNFVGMIASSLTGVGVTCGSQTINGTYTSGNIDFYANPLYKVWQAAAALKTAGILIGDESGRNTSRSSWIVRNTISTLTHEEQAAGEITHAEPSGYDTVSNSISSWLVYKTYIGTSRIFRNNTGSAIADIDNTAIVLTGSGATARVPIVNLKFPSAVTLNDGESLQVILKIYFITNVDIGG